MGEPEVEPGAQPGTLAPEHSETAEEINRDTEAPLFPNPTNEAALSETEVEDKGTVSLAGEVGAIAEEVALGDEEGEAGAMAGDGNVSVKEEGVRTVECSMQPEAMHEAVITGTEEVVKEEGPQIDHQVKREAVDDQVEASIKEEVGPAVETDSFREEGAVAEVVIGGGDDMMAKEEEEIEQKVELIGEAERKEEDFTQTDKEVPHTDQDMVHSGTNNEGADGLQAEDKNLTQDEEIKINESMHDDTTDGEALHTDQAMVQLETNNEREMVQLETNNERADGLQSEDNNLTQDEETKMDESMHDHQTDEEAAHTDQEMVHSKTNKERIDGLQSEDNNLTQEEETTIDESKHDDHNGDMAMDEDLTTDGDGGKRIEEDEDEDLTQDGDGDKAMEVSMGVDGDGFDHDAADDQAPEHGNEGEGTNEGDDDEDDDPPPLPAKRSSSGRKKRSRPTRIKKGEEELCFICFDGGELVVCDRRSDN